MKIIKNLKQSCLATKRVFVTLGVMAVVTALVVTALATPGSGIVSATVLARASFKEPVDLKFKLNGDDSQIVHAPDAQDTVIQHIVIAPGGTTGWHSHPGPAVAMIAAGELTLYSSEDPTCTPRTYSAGEAFIDQGQGHVHLARNLSGQNVELWPYFRRGWWGDPAGCSQPRKLRLLVLNITAASPSPRQWRAYDADQALAPAGPLPFNQKQMGGTLRMWKDWRSPKPGGVW
jgi:quercetin dioxygenase-like cupin family protein